jgi:hypothetical protein
MRHAAARPARARRSWLLGFSVAFVVVLVAVVALLITFLKPESGKPPVAAENSKANCITLGFRGGVINQLMITAANNLTGKNYNCLSTFANPMPTWSDWVSPWMFATTSDGWDAWLAASPAHQAIVGIDLIPQEVSNLSNPLTWEQACAAGSYNRYATTLAKNLVSYGAGKVVIRLGIEANGKWEADYVGTSATEMRDWAQCYDNEVTAMRAVPGADFLFVWNPNICTEDLPINMWYPGDSYVDIIGADAYDLDCSTQKTVSQEGWAAYSRDTFLNKKNDPSFPSLVNIEAFAKAHSKPFSFPEWGLGDNKPDDTAYVEGLAQIFNESNFSFESYFDDNTHGIAQLGTAIPHATAAYAHAFKK